MAGAPARVDAPLVEATEAAFAHDGPVAAVVPGYAVRPAQVAMARAVAGSMSTGGPLVVEAGTGVGKTWAYLVPALLSGLRVLVSTGTKTLQDQLYRRDLPQIRRALASGATVALLKGRANYVCHYHLRRNLAEGLVGHSGDLSTLRRIERFAAVSVTGDRSEAEGIAEDHPVWALATSTRENCLGQECPDFARCFVFRARQAAHDADIVVVNHHLFCADLALRDDGVNELLPSVHAVIFDEAHQLPDTATRFLGRGVSTRQLIQFARDLRRIGIEEAPDGADWAGLGQVLELAVQNLRMAAGSAAGRPRRLDRRQLQELGGLSARIRSVERALPHQVLEHCAERGRELARLHARADELRMRLREWQASVYEPGGRVTEEAGAEADTDGCRSTVGPGGSPAPGTDAGGASAVASPDDVADDEAIYWMDVFEQGLSLQVTPLSVAQVLERHRQNVRCAWIHTSATLAVADRFDHFLAAVGLPDAHTLQCDSPFDYARQALLYLPDDCGDPASADFAARISRAAWPLILANRGRAFVLCTSLRMVDRLARLLAAEISRSGCAIELLVQAHASRSTLLERFRAAAQPLLIGSTSFWEGIDVAGDRLSLVVIDKLPFSVPDDPVLAARLEAARRAGQDPFRTLQLPAAAMALKQGAGRLIRSGTDRGLLMICDQRITTRSYGRTLLASLPPFRITHDAREALEFCQRQGGGAGPGS